MPRRFGELKTDDGWAFDNFSGTVNPTSTDSAPTYDIGSRWVNTNTGEVFFCTNNAEGAAVWSQITNQGTSGTSLFELDTNGDLQPGTGTTELMELDANGDLQPKV